jgi:hypothetical protein
MAGEESHGLSRHSAAPVHDCAEDIENQRLNIREGLHR